MSKYRNKKVVHNDIKFDSIVERDFYLYCLKNKESMKIKDIILKKTYTLQEKYKLDGKTIRAITYTPDVVLITMSGKEIAIDVKGGILTEAFKLKAKMFRYKYRDVKLYIVGYRKKLGGWVDLEKK